KMAEVEQGDREMIPVTLVALAKSYRGVGNISQARKFAEEALVWFRRTQFADDEIEFLEATLLVVEVLGDVVEEAIKTAPNAELPSSMDEYTKALNVLEAVQATLAANLVDPDFSTSEKDK